MKMTLENAHKILWEAADIIATGEESLPSRVRAAAAPLKEIDDKVLPPELREKFIKLRQELLQATEAPEISKERSTELAEEILTVYMSAYFPEWQQG